MLLEQALTQLKNKTGFPVHIEIKNPLIAPNLRATLLIRLDVGHFQIPLLIEMKTHLNSLEQIAPFLSQRPKLMSPLFFVAETISPSIRDEFQNKRIGYLDLIGNFFLPIDLLIQSSRQRTQIAETERSKTRSISISSDSVIKLGLLLIHDPHAIKQSQRILAKQLGLSLGAVNNAVHGMIENRFLIPLPKGQFKLKDPKEFIHWWALAYSEGLRAKLALGTFKRIEKNTHWWKGSHALTDKMVWGGEPAAAILTKYLTPELMTVYLYDSSPLPLPELKLVPSEAGNITLFKAFWPKTLIPKETHLAPSLVVYADLIASRIDRNIETAEMIKKNIIENYEKKYAR